MKIGSATSWLIAVALLGSGKAHAQDDPCDELVTYLRVALDGPAPEPIRRGSSRYGDWEESIELSVSARKAMIWHDAAGAYAARVTPACRAETRRGAAPEATAAARALTRMPEPGSIDRGRIVLCAMQDPESLPELAAWMADPDHVEARVVCASELATWPGAEPLRGAIFGRALRIQEGWLERSEIDPAVVAATHVMGSPELREQLVPLLAAGQAQQALGYDRLREAVCQDDGAMSRARAEACSTLPIQAEGEWRRSRQPRRRVVMGVATGLYAGAITAAALERDNEVGRVIATGAGVPLGAVTGFTMAGILTPPPRGKSPPAGSKVASGLILVGGAIVGSVVGGYAAHSLSPRARAPFTALALAPVYFGFVLAVDHAD